MNFSEPPLIFVASQTSEFLLERRHLFEAFRTQGWRPWIYEVEPEACDTPALNRCFQAIARADVFVLLLGRSLGFNLDDSVVSFTESELLEAERLNKPILVYQNEAARPDPFVTNFLTYLADPAIGHCICPFTTSEDLAARAVRDIQYELAQKTRILNPDGGAMILPWALSLAVGDHRPQTHVSLLDEYQSYKQSGDFKSAERIGSLLAFQIFSTALDQVKWPETHRFLLSFHHLLAVRGRLIGTASAATIAKSHCKMAIRVGDLAGAVRAASALTGIYLLAERNNAGMRWSDWTQDRMAAVANQSALLDVLCSVETKRGHTKQAIQYARHSENTYEGDPEEVPYYESRIAGAHLSLPHRKGVETAREMLRDTLESTPPQHHIRADVLTCSARAAIMDQDLESARAYIKDAREISLRCGLILPIRDCIRLQAEAENQ